MLKRIKIYRPSLDIYSLTLFIFFIFIFLPVRVDYFFLSAQLFPQDDDAPRIKLKSPSDDSESESEYPGNESVIIDSDEKPGSSESESSTILQNDKKAVPNPAIKFPIDLISVDIFGLWHGMISG
jgi:hypothetical protein